MWFAETQLPVTHHSEMTRRTEFWMSQHGKISFLPTRWFQACLDMFVSSPLRIGISIGHQHMAKKPFRAIVQ